MITRFLFQQGKSLKFVVIQKENQPFRPNNRAKASEENDYLIIKKMKEKEVLLLLLVLAICHCQQIQTQAKSTISPTKTGCDPNLMRGLAMPTAQIPDNQAVLSLYRTIKNSTNPSQVLSELTKYSPTFVGLFLTYIQQIRLLRKKVEATDQATRTKCMAGYQVKYCVQICTSDIVATPEYRTDCNPEIEGCNGNFFVPDDEECVFQETFGHLLLREAFGSSIQIGDSDNYCPSEFSVVNTFFENECYQDFYDSQQTRYVPQPAESDIDSEATGNYQWSSIHFDDPDINNPYVLEFSANERRRVFEVLRVQANYRLGANALEDLSLRCIDASYLLQQNL